MQLTTENCSLLYIGSLQKAVKKIVQRNLIKPSDPEYFQQMEKELKRFKVNDQTFDYTPMKNKLGGHRWFFICPKCKRRVSKLFLPPEGSGREILYLCVECHKLSHQSAVLGQSEIYKKVIKPLRRLKEIEQKLDRGYLNQDKIKKYLDEYELIENRLKKTPEYRLYVFKRKHGLKI